MVEHEMIDLKDIDVYYPGNPDVLNWDVVADVPFTVRMDGEDIVIGWPDGTFKDWYTEWLDVGQGPVPLYGVIGVAYETPASGVPGDAAEYMRQGREDSGTRFNFAEKRRHLSSKGHGPIAVPGRVGIFMAGKWRHESNPKQEWRHRTEIKWFKWPSLEPLGETPVEPEGEISEANLRYIASRLVIRVG